MLENRKDEEERENFIERKSQWKSSLDTKVGPSMMITVLPAVVMCVFFVLAAPYLKTIVENFLEDKEEPVQMRKAGLKDAPEAKTEEVIPGNPDHADAEFYQKLYDEQGINWRDEPVIEMPEPEVAAKKEITLEPVDVEISTTLLDTEIPIGNN